MACPVCNSEHTLRPIQCLQQATLDHVSRCGISTEHSGNCLLKRLAVYVEANPQWTRRAKPKSV
jgi:transcription elongation factor Elf1